MRRNTAWFKSSGDFVLSAPPPFLANRPDLKVWDVFFHDTQQMKDPQMWVWLKAADGQHCWKPVKRGYVRTEDKRKLSFGRDQKHGLRPKWLGEDWFTADTRKQKKDKGKRRMGKL